MSPVLVLGYGFFSLFLFYQQLHVKNFRGASAAAKSFLTTFAFVAMIGGYAFVIYYGYKVSWLGALALLCIGLTFRFFWFRIEAFLGLGRAGPFISIAGFLGIPICAYLMWWGASL